MKAFMIKLVLILIFIVSFEINVYLFKFYNTINFALIASVCIWSFIYFECNYRKPKDQDNIK